LSAVARFGGDVAVGNSKVERVPIGKLVPPKAF